MKSKRFEILDRQHTLNLLALAISAGWIFAKHSIMWGIILILIAMSVSWTYRTLQFEKGLL